MQPIVRGMLEGTVRDSNQWEVVCSVLVVYLEALRIGLLKLADRLVGEDGLDAREDIFNLAPNECVATDTSALSQCLTTQRACGCRRQSNDWTAAQEPDTITEHGEVSVMAAVPIALAVGAWSGTAVGADSTQGLARLADHATADMALQAGDILVTSGIDPVWTPLFLKAGTVVMETGDYLSHSAIVTREFGIPAVMNVPDIRARLKSDETIRVDSDTGTVSGAAG